jgi:hypothetical protein
MKRLLFFLLTSGMFPANSQSVSVLEDTSEIKRQYTNIIYDFNQEQPDRIFQHGAEKIKKISKIWFGKRIMFHLKINPFLYDVYIGSRQVLDGGLNDSAGIRAFIAALDTLRKVKSAEVENKTIDKTPAPLPSKDIAASLELAEVGVEIKNLILQNSLKKYTSIETLSDAVDNKSNKELIVFEKYIKEADSISSNYEINYSEYISHRKIYFSLADSFFKKASILRELITSFEHITALLMTDRASDIKIRELIDNYTKYVLYEPIDSLPKKITYWASQYQNDLFESFAELGKAYQDLQDISIKITHTKIRPFRSDSISFTKIQNLYNSLHGNAPKDVAEGLVLMLNNLFLKNSFAHPYHSVLVEKDTLIYSLKIKPSSRFLPLISRAGIKLYNIDSFDYKIPVKGGFKLNASIGMAFMFNSLRPTGYYLNPVHSDTPINNLPDTAHVRILETRRTNRFRPAVSAYMHAYFKLGGFITPALTIGVSTNPTDFSDASYFLGLSGIVGHQSRFIFTVGLAGSKVEYLKGKYDTNKTYIKKDFININDNELSEKSFRAGLFFGVSYNISSNR